MITDDLAERRLKRGMTEMATPGGADVPVRQKRFGVGNSNMIAK